MKIEIVLKIQGRLNFKEAYPRAFTGFLHEEGERSPPGPLLNFDQDQKFFKEYQIGLEYYTPPTKKNYTRTRLRV